MLSSRVFLRVLNLVLHFLKQMLLLLQLCLQQPLFLKDFSVLIVVSSTDLEHLISDLSLLQFWKHSLILICRFVHLRHNCVIKGFLINLACVVVLLQDSRGGLNVGRVNVRLGWIMLKGFQVLVITVDGLNHWVLLHRVLVGCQNSFMRSSDLHSYHFANILLHLDALYLSILDRCPAFRHLMALIVDILIVRWIEVVIDVVLYFEWDVSVVQFQIIRVLLQWYLVHSVVMGKSDGCLGSWYVFVRVYVLRN